MAQIGNLGSLITFEVSSKKTQTFRNFTKTAAGRWTSHAIIGGKPKSEFLGPDQHSISLSIVLSTNLGIKPRKNLERIERAVEKGTPYTLVIGGKKVGENKWVVSSLSETWDAIIKDGVLVSASVDLTLQEYR